MAFIGNTPTTQAFTPAIDYFSGNGSTTAFTLSRPVASVAQVQVVIDNVAQNPSSAYTVSSNTITFTSAPLSGTNNIYVYYTSPITDVIAPGQGTVGLTQLTATGTASSSTYLRGDNSWGAIAANAISNGTSNVTIASSNGAITAATAGTTAVTIDTSQNVGIGGTPDCRLNVISAGTTIMRIYNTTNAVYGRFQTETGSFLIQTDTNHPLKFAVNNGAEAAGIDTSSNFKFNSGYGSSATAYGCRAWVNFAGSTGTIRASGNVSSVTRNGTGDYTVNFTTAMPDANYSANCSSAYTSTSREAVTFIYGTPTSSAIRILTGYTYTSPGAFDMPYVYLSVFR